MKIDNIGTNNKIYPFRENTKVYSKEQQCSKSDVIEISDAAKHLSSYASCSSVQVSDKKVQELKSQVESGTYNVNAKLVAQKMINIIKGREI